MATVEIVKIILALFAIVINCSSTAKLKSCNLHKLKMCPGNSTCQQLDFSTGDCQCIDGYDFNENYKNTTDYCLKSNKTIFDKNASNHVPNDYGNQTLLDSTKTIVNIQPPASSHHLIFGILISILLVVSVLTAAYGIKKINPVRRLREYIITRRRNRPMYADVTMSQENDDPPLI